jgi:hypothetical protein
MTDWWQELDHLIPPVYGKYKFLGELQLSDMTTGNGGPNPRLTHHLPGGLLRELQNNGLAPI